MSAPAPYGMAQAKKGQPDMSANARKPMNVNMGQVKNKKMGYYKDPQSDDLTDDVGTSPMDMQQMQAMGGAPMGNMYQQGMPYGLMAGGGQMMRPSMPQAQYSGARPPYPGAPPSPSRGGLLYLNGAGQRGAPPAQMGMNMGLFAPPQRSNSAGNPAVPPQATVTRTMSQPQPPMPAQFAAAPRPPFSPSSTDAFPRLREGPDEVDQFPALGQRGPMANLFAAARQGRKEDFSMLQDDFPALPGAKANKSPDGLGDDSAPYRDEDGLGEDGVPRARAAPVDDVSEGYGLLGLLSVIRMTDPDVNMLALGTDLTSLGLNLSSPDILYSTFLSPWVESNRGREGLTLPAVLATPPKFHLPPATTPQRMAQLSEETLFFLFYSMPMDALQQCAAAALYARDWRFHKEMKVWITRQPGAEPQKLHKGERGMYMCFDATAWKKVSKELTVEYELLEDRRPLPSV
eukprot:m.13267 g.13267  ORF g.13267 m.13267 type:complete len:459 (-) comp2807_c0_seq2:2413-3789(-)